MQPESLKRSTSQPSWNNVSIDGKSNTLLLPDQHTNLAHLAIDIGGTLSKIVYYNKAQESGKCGTLNFTKFLTANIDGCIEFIKEISRNEKIESITATGGGAHKFYTKFKNELQVSIQREDEMACLVAGLDFCTSQIPYEVFSYDEKKTEPMSFITPGTQYPYLLVNIGSGVSILKITGQDTFERVSGTSLGGGTLSGLLSLLTNANTYDEMLELSKHGDNHNVDMLVGDIYGGHYNNIGLKKTTIASSFGNVAKIPKEQRSNIAQEDISRSLLYLVSNNIGQIAYLTAKLEKVERIYFSGFFIRGHPQTMNTLSYAINFWSKGSMTALFLRHEGYLGAIGAFLRHNPINKRASASVIIENFVNADKIGDTSLTLFGKLHYLERNKGLSPFPHLKTEEYSADTSDLTDASIQSYWIDLLDRNLCSLVELAIKNGTTENNIVQKASDFEAKYRSHLNQLRHEPSSYGVLTVRSLLNLREQCLREMGLNDIFKTIKDRENETALIGFKLHIEALDRITDKVELVKTLVYNVQAGNIWDWGSTSILALLNSGKLDFETAQKKVKHPEKFNHINEITKRFITVPFPYKKAVVFVDNAGADVILGVLPFIRYMANQGCKVVLAANTSPSVNDITATELKQVIDSVEELDDSMVWKENVTVQESGSQGPCLDLTRVNEKLNEMCVDADLIFIEGMGRSIHTNFFAKFKIDSLKIAVFKNPQVAEYLGAEMYDGMALFEQV